MRRADCDLRGPRLCELSDRLRPIRMPHLGGIHEIQALPIIAGGAMLVEPACAAMLFVIGAVPYAVGTAGLLYRALSVRRATQTKTRQELQ